MITLNELSHSINSIDRVLRPVSSNFFCILAPRVTKLCDKLLRINEAHISNCNIAGTGPYYSHGLTLIQAWSSSHTQYKVWDEITYDAYMSPGPYILNFPVTERLAVPRAISDSQHQGNLPECRSVHLYTPLDSHNPFHMDNSSRKLLPTMPVSDKRNCNGIYTLILWQSIIGRRHCRLNCVSKWIGMQMWKFRAPLILG